MYFSTPSTGGAIFKSADVQAHFSLFVGAKNCKCVKSFCLLNVPLALPDTGTFIHTQMMIHTHTQKCPMEALEGHREMCWFTLCRFRSVNLPENRAGISRAHIPPTLGSCPLPTHQASHPAAPLSQQHTGHPWRHWQEDWCQLFSQWMDEESCGWMEEGEPVDELNRFIV